MTVQLSQSARPGARPTESAKQDGLEQENPHGHPSEIPVVAEMGNRPGLSEAAFEPGTAPRWRHH